jgi:TusE/DsrC/DsvC family sulfur relay protein
MPTVEYAGKNYDVDEDGFLTTLDQWDNDWVDYVKESEGIPEVTDEHWKVINMLQDYYKKNGIAPMVRILSKVTGFKLKIHL